MTYGGSVECVAFSPDDQSLVSGHDDNALRVWDLCSEQPPRLLKGHTNVVQCVAFSPDSQLIASGAQDRTVRIWNARTGELRLTYKGHSDQIKGLIFSPDGQTLLSSGRDRTIQACGPLDRGCPVCPPRPHRYGQRSGLQPRRSNACFGEL